MLSLVPSNNGNILIVRRQLQWSSVKSTAKSITKYTWKRRSYYASRHERKIGLNPQLPLETKQSLGATYTATIKAEASQAKIKAAKTMMLGRGEKVTQKAISEATGLSLRTIKTY